ncbi:MAG: hypothetical protein UV73_C0005G0026 [Candidatus Gottesmanbacteria bacterium GW2011_GWA2_43_14]|uniref:Uncharacterized protein n=1 Tax=Candidatus Gottesmanbacteria bacterium GW2011_GWA2_43_14 TaxID=1618443 RepID=A0A0G1DJD0_9BACT|nr:MAG: hypothetical protein UV73_C0005G0026 [Candidatus Gottesmanbacteria bacterium GW2011_GWA2_43_14]
MTIYYGREFENDLRQLKKSNSFPEILITPHFVFIG